MSEQKIYDEAGNLIGTEFIGEPWVDGPPLFNFDCNIFPFCNYPYNCFKKRICKHYVDGKGWNYNKPELEHLL